jgi:diguanylate cyclase (GGDEF)-like protein
LDGLLGMTENPCLTVLMWVPERHCKRNVRNLSVKCRWHCFISVQLVARIVLRPVYADALSCIPRTVNQTFVQRPQTLIAALVASVLALFAITLITVQSMSAANLKEQYQDAQAHATERLALEAKYQAADFNGWQTAYAFDIVRGAPIADLRTNPNRLRFIQSSKALEGTLALLGEREAYINSPERSELQTAREAFRQFMLLDDQIVADYQTLNSGRTKRATNLVLGAELELFSQVTQAMQHLNDDIRADRQAQTENFNTSMNAVKQHMYAFTALLIVTVLSLTLGAVNLLRQREHLTRQLEKLARTDALTGVANRHVWNDRLDHALEAARRTSQPLTVAIIDLDHFKAFNDAYGHPAGDTLLRETAKAFESTVRQGDLIARYGGEEFSLLLPNCTLSDAKTLIERLRSVMRHGQRFSAGITQTNGWEHSEDIVIRADRALYEAKALGRNCTVTTEGTIPGSSLQSIRTDTMLDDFFADQK